MLVTGRLGASSGACALRSGDACRRLVDHGKSFSNVYQSLSQSHPAVIASLVATGGADLDVHAAATARRSDHAVLLTVAYDRGNDLHIPAVDASHLFEPTFNCVEIRKISVWSHIRPHSVVRAPMAPRCGAGRAIRFEPAKTRWREHALQPAPGIGENFLINQ